MKPRDYCCCAIPVVNFGIYSTLTEQFVLGILAGTLSIATPEIVGAATPSFARWIFAIICYVGAMVQVLGFIGVAQEKPVLFKRYTALHSLVTVAAFSIAAVWIAISASRHSTAKSNCEQKFFTAATDLTSEGETMCEIFPWVDIGLMGGLWVLLAISQFYFFAIVSGYGVGQRGDHEKYNSIYSMTGLNSDIPLANRSDPWDSRIDSAPWNGRYGHTRQESTASDTAMLNNSYKHPSGEPFAQPPVVPTGYTGQPDHHQYEEYNDSFYHGAQRP
ncbi:hypothetical protein B0F90DRAFT_1677318 [Multifurca ochricompacta]|uniref:Uncharacterized protein n=1 Tax=Multifurca ochricompacta TaxID=376703 RepID=A0AAD4MCF7_9AGAM|nr:hypothetical protein B0F90DRAFT_1677318 [Multifurca ochricompacta]